MSLQRYTLLHVCSILGGMESENPESINPYAVTVHEDSDRLNARVGPLRVVRFRGEVEQKHLRAFYREPGQFGCVTVVLLIGVFTWITTFYFIFGVMAAVILLVLAAILAYWFGMVFLSNMRSNRLAAKRPWLIGPTHGTLSGSRWTVWNNDVCLQTNDPSYFDDAFKGAVLYPRGASPIAFAPSTCFFEHEWQEVYEDYRRSRFSPLVIEAPPEGAWICCVAARRVMYLTDRLRALRWKLSQNVFWVAVVCGMLSFLFLKPHVLFGQWVTIALPVALWSMIEVGRLVWFRWSVGKQFQPERGTGYRLSVDRQQAPESLAANLPKPSDMPLVQWFTRDTILSADLTFWIRCPTSRVDRVHIDQAAIEFFVGGLCLTFHREGFADEKTWTMACDVAQAIGANRATLSTS